MGVLLVVRLNLSHSAVKAVSVLHAALFIPFIAQLPCPLNSFNVSTDIVCLPFLKNSVFSFEEIVPHSTVSFILFVMSFFVCSASSTNPNVLLPVLSVSSTPSAAVFNGILTSMSSFPKSLSVALLLGNALPTLTILFCANLFVLLSSIIFTKESALLSKK